MLEFRVSPIRHAGLVALCLILGGSMMALAWLDPSRGSISRVFLAGVGALLALGSIPIVFQAVKTKVAVVIDEQGIEDRRGRIGKVLWRDCSVIEIRSVRQTEFLCLTLFTPDLYLLNERPALRPMATLSKKLGYGDLSFSFIGLKPGIEEAKQFLVGNGILMAMES